MHKPKKICPKNRLRYYFLALALLVLFAVSYNEHMQIASYTVYSLHHIYEHMLFSEIPRKPFSKPVPKGNNIIANSSPVNPASIRGLQKAPITSPNLTLPEKGSMWQYHLLKYTSILGCLPISKQSSVPLSSIQRRAFSMEEERTINPYRSAEIPSISDRLEFLFDNPLQIQELTFKENCKPLNEILDLTCSPNLQVNQDIAHSERYQIVNFQRLIFSYHANRLYLRVVDAKARPVVLVLPPENVAAFVNSSRDAYSTLLADWDRAPPVVIELFNSSFTFSHRSRYGILVYDFVFRSWELIGFIAPLGCDKSESGQSPNPIIRLIEYFQPNLKKVNRKRTSTCRKRTSPKNKTNRSTAQISK